MDRDHLPRHTQSSALPSPNTKLLTPPLTYSTLPTADKKEKSSSKEGGKDSKRSSGTGDKLLDRKLGKEKDGKPAAAAAAAKPAPRGPRGPPPPAAPPKKGGNDYLAAYDLPSSESESDEEVDRRRGFAGSDEDEPKIKEVRRERDLGGGEGVVWREFGGGVWGRMVPYVHVRCWVGCERREAKSVGEGVSSSKGMCTAGGERQGFMECTERRQGGHWRGLAGSGG